MSQKFQASVNQREDVAYVKIVGVIDEDNQLTELIEQIPPGTAVVDVGEVERINSCGVRDWVNWLSRLEGQRTRIVLVECSPAIVAQINLVNNFTGAGVVKSFYVPYFCSECDEEKVLLVETVDMGPAPYEPPTCRCDECDLVMVFDDMVESYFAFLSSTQRAADSDKVQTALRALAPGKAPSDDGKGKVRSRNSAPAIPVRVKSPTLPNVPSLPSLTRTTGPHAAIAGRPVNSGVPTRLSDPHLSGSLTAPVAAQLAGQLSGAIAARPPVAPPKSNVWVYAVVSVLVLVIGVLGFLIVTR